MIQALIIMHQRVPYISLVAIAVVAMALGACGGTQKKAKSDDDKLVPEETQQRARERQGSQQLMWDEMGMTPSEQAGAHHESATKPVENPKYGKDKDKKKK